MDLERAGEDYPLFVAGLPLYDPPAKIAARCRQSGGVWAAFRQSNEVRLDAMRAGDLIACNPPPVDPFAAFNPTIAVVVKFCPQAGLHACEIWVKVRDESPDAAAELLRRFEDKYGPAMDSPPEFNCRNPSDRRQQFRRVWYFVAHLDGRQTPIARIVLGRFCTAEAPNDPPGVSLFYQGMAEVFDRLRDADAGRKNF